MKLLSKKELRNKFNLKRSHYIEPSTLSCHCDVVEDCSNITEHKSWGAYLDKDKNVTFKIATFPDVTAVAVEIKSSSKRKIKVLPLENKCNGIFELKVNKKFAKESDRYRFIIYRPNMNPKRVRDPYSMCQDKFPSWSIIFNHYGYRWHDKKWVEGKNSQKVSRIASPSNKLSPVGSLRIYEINIPSFTEKGTYKAAKDKLKEISKLGFNAVQIMPLENCFAYNWGYDGVDKFAPHKDYGTPNDFKSLVDYAHSIGLNVIMDMVPNHIGEDMGDISNAGPYTDGCNEFGLKFNYEKENYQAARTYIVNAALNWLVNYHCDGLRLDLTKYMNSDFTMKLIAAEVHHHVPDAFLIAEDARENDVRVTAPFTSEENSENNMNHCRFTKSIMNNKCSLENLGFDSEWDFPYHKQITALMLEYWCGFPKSITSFDRVMKNSGMRVKYPMSHDEIGNIDGTRLITKIFAKEIDIYKNIPKNYKNRREQHFAHVAHHILKMLLTGKLEKMSPREFQIFVKRNYLALKVNVSSLKQAYRIALKKYRLAVGATCMIPGPKMIFQGDEKGEMTYFKFFRELSCGYEKNLESKGYKPGLEAFKDSKLGNIKYSRKYDADLNNTAKFVKTLNKINSQNKALQTGKVEETISHPISWVHASCCAEGDNKIFAIKNFSDVSYYSNYLITFPKGKWEEIINSDSSQFGGDDNFLNKKVIISDGETPTKISLPDWGLTAFKYSKIK